MDIRNELVKYKDIIEEHLDKILPNEEGYQKKIYEAMRYSIFAGGKRLRPFLILKTCEMVSGNYKNALPFASAIEMIHTYSLIHDDLPAMDDDDLRRGRPTNHKVFGEAIAILAGDGLLNFAFETMIKAMINDNSEKYINAFNEISKAAGIHGMIGGQVVDILSENKEIDKDTLDFIHKKKTSALIEASVVAGGILGGATNEEVEALRDYGRSIGLGFQIRDDILDRIGNVENLGKDIGSDEENNKATYLSLYGIDNAIEKTKELCTNACNSLRLFDKYETSIFTELAEYLVYRKK